MISPFSSSSRERARDYPFYRLRLLFTLKTTVSLFYKAKQSAWRWSEESSINTREHDAGHSINETADHFIKHICLTFCFFGVRLTNRPSSDRWQNGTNKSKSFDLVVLHWLLSLPLCICFYSKWGCTSRWAGAGLPLSYAAFISLAELGGSCNKPLSRLLFSYVFMKASRLSRSGPSINSVRSSWLPALIRLPWSAFRACSPAEFDLLSASWVA